MTGGHLKVTVNHLTGSYLQFTGPTIVCCHDAMLYTTLLNRHVAAVDAATNTEMDFKWFEFDDTVLGLRKTGVMLNRTLSAEESVCQPVPAQVLVSYVGIVVSHFMVNFSFRLIQLSLEK